MNWESSHSEIFINIRRDFLICLFLVIATLAVYGQVGNNGFVDYDDDVYIVQNPRVQSGFTCENMIWAFTATDAANWHPLTWLSHIADVELYGMNPGPHHLTSLILHILNTLLLFILFRQMTAAIWQSAFVAALFALHPLHVESVAQAAERKDVLSTFFWLLTIWGYIRYVRFPGIKNYLTVLLFFILGLMAKPMLVTLPCVLILLDYWPLGRPAAGENRSHRIFIEKIPFFMLSAGSCVLTFFVQQSGGAVKSLDVYPLTVRIANALVAYIAYIQKMICPSGLAFLYPHPGMPAMWKTGAAFILLVSVSLLAVRQMRQQPYLIVGWLWFAGTLVPVIGLVQVGLQAMADRYTYIPLIGIFIIMAWGIPELAAKCSSLVPDRALNWKSSVAAAAGVIFSLLMIVAWLQVRYWKNSITLFEHALAVTTGNYMTHNNLGFVLQQKSRTDEAIRHYAEAIGLKPDYAIFHNNMGTALEEQGKLSEAFRYYSEAMRLNPRLPKVYNNMGSVLEKQNKPDEAMKQYIKALELNPDYIEAHINLGALLLRKGNPDEAIAHFRNVLRIKKGNDAAAYNNIGVALFSKGRADEAIAHFKKALEIDPACSDAYNNLQNLLSDKKK